MIQVVAFSAGILCIIAALFFTGELRIDWSWFRRKKGRHRGKYTFRMLWPHNVFLHGQHRGKYVEKPHWKEPRPKLKRTKWSRDGKWGLVDDGTIVYRGKISIGPPPSTGAELKQLVQEREREFREEVVRDELASTPIYTGLKYGEFGDSAFDRADPPPVCGPLSV